MRTLALPLVMLLAVLPAMPLASAALPPSPLPVDVPPVCVPVYDFPDNGLFVCVDADGPCYVFVRRVTFIGPQDDCLVPGPQ